MLRQVTVLLLLVFLGGQIQADNYKDPYTRDLLVLTGWFEGEFNNEEQIWFHRRSGTAGAAPTQIHMINKRVESNTLGEHVFYVEEYADNDPDNVIRQRWVTFTSDVTKGAIRMRQGFFKSPERYRGAYLDDKKLAGISPDDIFFVDGCDVFIRRVADQYQGAMEAKSCVFGDGDERRYSVHNITLSTSKFWRDDATYRVADDSFFKGTPPAQPTKFRRAKIFYCDFYTYKKNGQSQKLGTHRVHGQGGTARVSRGGDSVPLEILIRQKEYPYYSTRPDFIYYSVRNAGEARSIAFGVADADSRQFGLKSGDSGVFCHRLGYTFQQNVDEL